MSSKAQQYTGRLYTQAEVDRLVREARIDELKKLTDWELPLGTEVKGRHRRSYDDRIAELSKEDV